jgi:hypothetical protein
VRTKATQPPFLAAAGSGFHRSLPRLRESGARSDAAKGNTVVRGLLKFNSGSHLIPPAARNEGLLVLETTPDVGNACGSG